MCLLDIAWLGKLAGQGAVLDAGVHASCIGAYMAAPAVVLALHGDTHMYTCMCHDMTSLAIMAGRLGAKTFCLPLAGSACHGLIA